MILVDFSSVIHRMIHTSISKVKPAKKNGKYVTAQFAGLLRYNIFQDLFSVVREHETNFGEIVICLDKSSHGYWRKDVYAGYKSNRKKGRNVSEINYNEVFEIINEMVVQLKENLPWKVIEVPRAEADDIMLVLAREYNKYEKVLIHSPDKDMIQAQRDNDTVFQYSALTKKWIVPENKHGNMDEWVQEHVCLGDKSDDVPKVVDGTEFSPNFLKYLEENDIDDILTPMDFKASDIERETKVKLLKEFNIYKKKRNGEDTDEKDIYKTIKFGPASLKKKIKEHGSLDDWLDSHPLYRPHYERNFKLVMEEGIPPEIWNEIIVQYKTSPNTYNNKALEEYLSNCGLKSIVLELPNYFKLNRPLTAEDFDW